MRKFLGAVSGLVLLLAGVGASAGAAALRQPPIKSGNLSSVHCQPPARRPTPGRAVS